MVTKTCRRCSAEKPASEFNKHPRNRDGLQSFCKECGSASSRESNRRIYDADPEAQRRKSATWRRNNPDRVVAQSAAWYDANRAARKQYRRQQTLKQYGLTPEQFDEMLHAQGGACFVCKEPPSGRWKQLAIDHCHKTGKVRGLLCNGCNRAIGYLKDDPSRAEAIAAYLRR